MHAHNDHSPRADTSRTGKDPVCGMTVDLDHPKGGKTVFEGREIGFCSSKCKARFEADPQRYLGEQRPPEPSAPAGTKWVCPMDPEVEADRPGPCPRCGMALEPATPAQSTRVEWTCPMHPQIVRDQPGTCPICGMALEPRTVSLEEENPELRDMSRRFWVSVVLTLPVFLLGMSDLLPGQPVQHAISPQTLAWIEFVLAKVVIDMPRAGAAGFGDATEHRRPAMAESDGGQPAFGH